ncbi:CoF synthetase [Algibacter miyuki]|uniref:CoF synthetase n=1 Tax=Algibacter miyuki TaxID=1306933 RepID=A0ABV5GYC6_9FLAO|nr:CoF synthetase [Algibacter miyuki]MDN3667143.1 CoF synthetase [Algibacter miyuki]
MMPKFINNLSEILRNRMFWVLDTVKGCPIKQHLNDISFILNHFDKPEAQQKIENNRNKLLEHSIETTAFYKSLNVSSSDFLSFPVINKNNVKAQQDQFVSNLFRDKKNTIRSTSGSTGTPFKVVHNKNKIYRNNADTIYFSELAGFKIGYQLWYIRHWAANFKNSNLKNRLQNLKPIEVLDLQPNQISAIIKQLQETPGHKGFLGFPSAFEQICKFLDEEKAQPLDTNITSIIGMAEAVNSYTKARMAYYFKTPMVSRYSNMENGILAQQMPNSNNFTINWASYHIEILNIDNDNQAPKGTLGRIVITDLFSYAMPLIRYDTGDIGSIDYTVTPPVLNKIEGRKTDTIYNTKGQIVSAFMMTESVAFPGINQIQFIQDGKTSYTIKLNCSNDFNTETAVIDKFKSFLGANADIQIRYVDEIPLLSSGKRKMTLNNYIKQ